MFDKERASRIPWFARIEVKYVQPREDKKQTELFYYRAYASDHLDVFKERKDLGRPNCSHNRSLDILIPYNEIEDVVVFTPLGSINLQTGDLTSNTLETMEANYITPNQISLG
jgi:hypothetical protein